ncbi:MAG: hypothetical protein L6367_15900, partial [Cellulomonas sp.]|nr:hypothetical protein [Cellulomonas sp.]
MTAQQPFLVLPTRSRYTPDEPVVVEVRGPVAGTVTVRHLDEVVATAPVAGAGLVEVGLLPPGGYGIELTCTDGSRARTAVLVTTSSRARLRYGFVASYAPDKDVDAVLDLVRALHLDAVQLYDWAYRHADLVGGGEQYTDALDQPIALSTVRRLVAGLAAVGSEALGYAAVYAVGNGEWDRWSHRAVLRADGAPWA